MHTLGTAEAQCGQERSRHESEVGASHIGLDYLYHLELDTECAGKNMLEDVITGASLLAI